MKHINQYLKTLLTTLFVLLFSSSVVAENYTFEIEGVSLGDSLLDYMSKNVHEFTDENFETDVTQSDLPVLIDFWAAWCGPCKAIAPLIDEIAGEYQGKIKVGKVDVDQNQNTAMKYGIRSIPTLLLMKNGEIVDQIVGAVPKGNITDILNKAV